MTRILFASAALLLSALPALAQAKPLTPPDVLGKAKTIQFTVIEYQNNKAVNTITVALSQPNKAFIQTVDAQSKKVSTTLVSDGKKQTVTFGSKYTELDPPTTLGELNSDGFKMDMFLDPAAFAAFHHEPADLPGVYHQTLPQHTGISQRLVLNVNPATGLPSSILVFVKLDSNSAESPAGRATFDNWKLDAPVADSTFSYTPTAEMHFVSTPKLLANGTAAPDFTVQDKDGKPVKLSDYRGKTVVLDFWATWCGPCQSSLPHTTEMAKKYAAKNVVVLAVNVWDSKAAFDGWLPKHPEYSALNFAIDPNPDQSKSVASALYGVSGIPTQYVIGPDGKIIKSIIGYEPGGHELEEALK